MQERREGGWVYDGPAASRLWEKSAIGVIIEDGKLLLNDCEVIFCNLHRGVNFPDSSIGNEPSNWILDRVRRNPRLLQEAAVLEALRVPGNKVVFSGNAEKMGFESSGSWALRWSSDNHPSKNHPVSEVLWYHANDNFSESGGDNDAILRRLLNWSESVTQKDRIAEVLVIDDEQSVVTYRLHEANPKGSMKAPSMKIYRTIAEMVSVNHGSNGAFYPDTSNWPSDSIGIPSHGGRQVDNIEQEIIRSSISGNGKYSYSARILLDLWDRGLNTRSGFKYGTTWRCYPGQIGDGHAPWLVVDPTIEGPENWAAACLSSRLASGVNKKWLYPIFDESGLRYLEISRPPSASRWSNPIRR